MYYELLSDGTIGRSSNNSKIAENLGLCLQTEKEIVYGYDGKRYFKGETPLPPEKTYVEKRQSEYPAISDQLDLIYWDTVNGTHFWLDKITEIKRKYPKT